VMMLEGDSAASTERTKSARASDTGSHSRAEGDYDEGFHTCRYYFGPSTVTISCNWEMIDQGYFAKYSGRAPGEETIPEPNSDEAIIFEEFFTAGLRMPPHPVLADILLKF
jgi:hypothetical protein